MSVSSSSTSSPEVRDVGVVVVAAGSGRRMGGVRKQYLDLAGEPVLLRALRPFLRHPRIGPVVVVLPSSEVEEPPEWLRQLPVLRVAGGEERSDSVRRGLDALVGGVHTVLVHDGARPLVTCALVDRVIGAVRECGALAAIAATDTIKQVDEDGRVTRTLPRAAIWQAQTPQGFPLAALRRCYARVTREGWKVTDDAEVFERCGEMVVVVEGERENLKITRPEDLEVAAAIVRRRETEVGGRNPES